MLAATTHFPLLKFPNPTLPLSKFYQFQGLKKTAKPPQKMGKEAKNYWLLKTEPGEWSWDDQAANKGLSKWDGVKNKQAQKYMKSMKLKDLCFFYHSGSKFRRVVGVVEVVREWYEEDGEGGGGAVDVREVGQMSKVVGLAEMKRELKGFVGGEGFALFRQPRLSVLPVEEGVWDRVCEMGGGYEKKRVDEKSGDESGE